jgi:hypothetical protein
MEFFWGKREARVAVSLLLEGFDPPLRCPTMFEGPEVAGQAWVGAVLAGMEGNRFAHA